jgi:para-nitrobenzyl esterase
MLHRTGNAAVYSYRFDWDEEPSFPMLRLSLLVGAAHGLDVAFTFGTFGQSGSSAVLFNDENREGREALSRAMMSYWAEFARTGNPAKGRDRDLPEWKPWGVGGNFMRLDTPGDDGPKMAHDATGALELIARLAKDPRAPSPRDKCRVLFWLTHRGRQIPTEVYTNPPGFDCKQFAPDSYPWGAIE